MNKHNRPYVLLSGTYKVESQVVDKYNDGKIHVLYAGTFEVAKGGVNAAIKAAEYLPKNYHLHVLGFGTDEEVGIVKDAIAEVSARSKATISYEGLKKGHDYIEFVQRCHIGLSTQDPSGAFNATSFPSKILSYLANGLKVVTVDIPVIRHSPLSDHMFYYKEQTPQSIAQAIEAASSAKGLDGRELIKRLDADFRASLDRFIKSLL
ncbi:MAG: glycosyltransferase [Muribaculaceae bacterium]